MKLTVGEALAAHDALQVIGRKPIKIGGAVQVAKALQELQTIRRLAHERRMAHVEELGQHDEKGKLVVVYYWASWNSQCASDFAKLKAMLATYREKGVEVVTVNLDSTPQEAARFLQQNPLPGTHLFAQGGLESPLAVNYGVFVLPNLFIVGQDGKVVSRNGQVTTLEDDLKKLLK